MMRITGASFTAMPLVALILCGGPASSEPAESAATAAEVEGLWEYTGLVSSSGVEMPLTGIFLFKDGMFVQQAVFDGGPTDRQGAMAHAGPYYPRDGFVHLVAEQTISTAPDGEVPLSFRANTEHDVTVTRNDDDLTLIFSMGTGTVQEFERIGPGEGVVHVLKDGALAFVDDYFLLVQGNEQGVVTGYGTFEKSGDNLDLEVIRWAEAEPGAALNKQDTSMKATFDGDVLTLADGRTFQVER